MTATCPNGHQSATTDYCDRCGAPITRAVPTRPAPESDAGPAAAPASDVRQPVELQEEEDTSAAELAQPCPRCGTPRSGDDRFCEGCGHDFLAPVQTGWEAAAAADRVRFERVAPTGLKFPERYPERRFPLDRSTMRIGRSRGRAGETIPEIDLAGDPEDPGVSHLHAELVRQDDGSYALRDLGSTNGTTVNDDPLPVRTDTPVPLAEGDRIGIGAWTTITLRTR